jgi:predicted nucleic acid-binding protein
MTPTPGEADLIRIVLADANVLYSRVLRDYLLYAADQEIIAISWSPQILAEVTEHLEKNLAAFDHTAGQRLVDAMNAAFPLAEIEPSEEHYSMLAGVMLPDQDDRHVLAAALAAEAAVLCTSNTKDFPSDVVTALGIDVLTPTSCSASWPPSTSPRCSPPTAPLSHRFNVPATPPRSPRCNEPAPRPPRPSWLICSASTNTPAPTASKPVRLGRTARKTNSSSINSWSEVATRYPRSAASPQTGWPTPLVDELAAVRRRRIVLGGHRQVAAAGSPMPHRGRLVRAAPRQRRPPCGVDSALRWRRW